MCVHACRRVCVCVAWQLGVGTPLSLFTMQVRGIRLGVSHLAVGSFTSWAIIPLALAGFVCLFQPVIFVGWVIVTCVCAGILTSFKHVKCLVSNQEPASISQAPRNSSLFPGISKMKDIVRKGWTDCGNRTDEFLVRSFLKRLTKCPRSCFFYLFIYFKDLIWTRLSVCEREEFPKWLSILRAQTLVTEKNDPDCSSVVQLFSASRGTSCFQELWRWVPR